MLQITFVLFPLEHQNFGHKPNNKIMVITFINFPSKKKKNTPSKISISYNTILHYEHKIAIETRAPKLKE